MEKYRGFVDRGLQGADEASRQEGGSAVRRGVHPAGTQVHQGTPQQSEDAQRRPAGQHRDQETTGDSSRPLEREGSISFEKLDGLC